jgi:hypothetical protein
VRLACGAAMTLDVSAIADVAVLLFVAALIWQVTR